MPTTFTPITDPNGRPGWYNTAMPEFCPPELYWIGHDYGDTYWLIGIRGEHRGKIFRAASGGSDWEFNADMEDLRENVNPIADDFTSLLDQIAAEAAIIDKDEETFATWLAEGHDINEPILGQVPLQIALVENNSALVKSMLGRGADPTKVEDIFHDIGRNPGTKAILPYFDALPDIDRSFRSDTQWRLIEIAVLADRPEVVKALLDRGAKPSKETIRMADALSKRMRDLLAPYRSTAA
jgi:hypothetical protein